MEQKNQELFSAYYVAHVKKSECWFIASVLRGTEHIAFDRALDTKEGIFEFFVPVSMEPVFLQIMTYLEGKQVIFNLRKLPNRFQQEVVIL